MPLPGAWQAAFSSHKVNKPGERFDVLATSEDGKTIFAETGATGGQHELAMITDGGRRRTIQSYPASDAKSQVLGASFDGRYLAFTLMHSRASFDPWTLYVWDSVAGGSPKIIADNSGGDGGQGLPGPLNYPVGYQGKIVWVQAVPGDVVEIREYDTASGQQKVVRRGHGATPFRMGSWLVWPESDAPGALTTLRAIGLDTGQPVTLPPQMTAITGPGTISASDDTVVWASTDRQDLYAWNTSWPQPRHLLTLKPGAGLNFDWPHVAGDLVTWTDIQAQFAGDLRTGSYTQITPQYGYTKVWGTSLNVGFAPSANGEGDQVMIDTRTLPPLPTCGGSTTT
ncbi:hypothetical protein ACNTMW_15990 [Planosporangium sp. 12N6]|uniref:hypothetical protein n=1 Tax=Planosporangium spinosum TaxID=3402278 RepID=UPI003CF2FE03